ncbi:FAD/NAD(P)-binding protein [uncultured Tateyamaria sp.]|uniref:FAD/NAD(P)-binding protein n=1 Tax=uncultured Tateyamaria sp. TaxID=455651 RepID=UPI002637450E|nr:FAD/NAD(P)-binding protein [uncultured Tateyamaria sp.]
MNEPHYNLAIVGLGPRGHYSLECFLHSLAVLSDRQDAKIILFEETDQTGNGPVWAVSQSASNWSNINDRILILPERPEIQLGSTTISAFPSYHDWASISQADDGKKTPDVYPQRRTVGQYLSKRFETLLQPILAAGLAELVSERVNDLSVMNDRLSVMTKTGASFSADQALLTVGHQPTRRDAQIKDWIAATEDNRALHLFPDPYPVEQIVNSVSEMTKVNMAVRGYGLATIDIARATAEAFGDFAIQDELTRAQSFKLVRDVEVNIVPFSLDGLPLGPKPLNERLDMQFKPSKEALDKLDTQLSDPKAQAAAQDETFLVDAIVPIIARIFPTLRHRRECAPADPQDLERLIADWITDQSHDHSSILSTDIAPVDLLQKLVGMSVGAAPVSLDYCIGQVWRHCHPTIYTALSHGQLSDEALAKIIFLDESMKRYSFGPPVESLQQLIALHGAGVLKLDHVNDPDIEVSDDGWTLSNGSNRTTATVMVDAVLQPPKIKDVNAPLMDRLLTDGILSAVHDDLGVDTTTDGFIVSDADDGVPVAVLGRLAKGTIIGVDAILECFGKRPQDWAAAAVKRMIARAT